MAEIITLFPNVIYKHKLENYQTHKDTYIPKLIEQFKDNPNQKAHWADLCNTWQESGQTDMGIIHRDLIPHIHSWLDEFNYPPFDYQFVSWFNVHTWDMYQEYHNHLGGPVVLCGIYYLQISDKDHPVLFVSRDETYSSHISNIGLTPQHHYFQNNSKGAFNIEEGDLLLFTPDAQHLVPKAKEKHDGYRITFSFNIERTG